MKTQNKCEPSVEELYDIVRCIAQIVGKEDEFLEEFGTKQDFCSAKSL